MDFDPLELSVSLRASYKQLKKLPLWRRKRIADALLEEHEDLPGHTTQQSPLFTPEEQRVHEAEEEIKE